MRFNNKTNKTKRARAHMVEVNELCKAEKRNDKEERRLRSLTLITD